MYLGYRLSWTRLPVVRYRVDGTYVVKPVDIRTNKVVFISGYSDQGTGFPNQTWQSQQIDNTDLFAPDGPGSMTRTRFTDEPVSLRATDKPAVPPPTTIFPITT